ncbi:hypothetical protein F2Q69_00001122 [Brassica cretica]|uniref:Uncharacterized protein n=1 Tax=Brassica cretica TaxID=69181 RepID=A0A8S9P2L4_BRACR|nr:hypothetical protein F2Q69_00001122 [Brassica cretica]
MKLVFHMKSCGWEVEDKEVVQKILSSLPLRFNEWLVEEAETLPVSDLIDFLLVHEYNKKWAQESVEESVTGVKKCVEESVDEFAWRVMDLANRLRFYGRNIPDDDVIFRIITKLPASFNESVSYIRTLKDVTITEVVEMLRGDEWGQRLMDEEASGSEKWCEFCRKKSHDTSECYSKNKKVRR